MPPGTRRRPCAVAALPAEFEIPAGTGLRAAVRRMEQAGIEVRPLQFELLARALGREPEIKAGFYQLAGARDAAASCSTS